MYNKILEIDLIKEGSFVNKKLIAKIKNIRGGIIFKYWKNDSSKLSEMSVGINIYIANNIKPVKYTAVDLPILVVVVYIEIKNKIIGITIFRTLTIRSKLFSSNMPHSYKIIWRIIK